MNNDQKSKAAVGIIGAWWVLCMIPIVIFGAMVTFFLLNL